jgi:hypothetical protein
MLKSSIFEQLGELTMDAGRWAEIKSQTQFQEALHLNNEQT